MEAFAKQKQAPFLRVVQGEQQSDQVPDNKIMITGRVVDSKGNPIIGATVMQKGTKNGTVTDLDGRYSLDVPGECDLNISYIGFKTRIVKAVNNSTISLDEDSESLNEVVVVGFGTQKKETLTGAISSIKGDEMLLTNSATTSSALAGKIAGINSRQSDGRPGSSTTINIRGMGTPLYVIDGAVKDEGQFNNIDPNDIESISILKDASAAIYGMRAANGVVVVTTKSGQRNTATKINVNTYYGCESWFKFPKPADTKTYVWAKEQSDVIRHAEDPNYSMEWTDDEYKKWEQGTEKGYQGWDWYDYITKTAPMSYVEANINGGSNNANYYVSLSHLNQEATIRGYGGFYRTNMQMNIDVNITPKFKVGANVNGRIEERKHPGVPGGDDTWTALYAIYRNLPTVRPYANDNPKYPQMTSSENSTNFAILNYATSGKYNDTWKVIQMNLTGEYDFLKELNLKGNLGYYYANENLFNHEYTYNTRWRN